MNWAKNSSLGDPVSAKVLSRQELGLCKELGGPVQQKVVRTSETRKRPGSMGGQAGSACIFQATVQTVGSSKMQQKLLQVVQWGSELI